MDSVTIAAPHALLYGLVTGQRLPESIARITGDPLRPAADFGVSKPLSDALAAGLALAAEDRPQTVEAFRARLTPAPLRQRPPRPEPPARPRLTWVAVPASVLAVLVGLGGWYQYRHGQQETGADQGAGDRTVATANPTAGAPPLRAAEPKIPTPPPVVAPPAAPKTGQLRVTVNSEAQIALDERPVGRATPAQPLTLEDLPVGEHQLSVTAPGFAQDRETVQIAQGQWSQVPVVLTPLPAPTPASPPAATPGPAASPSRPSDPNEQPVVQSPAPPAPAPKPTGPAADPATEQALALTPGQWRNLQARLAALGYYAPAQVDGEPGGGTREALRAWQHATALPASGYLDQGQLERLSTSGLLVSPLQRHRQSV